ncbi:hypothetical protein B4099_3698 [Heyndrickxia coagulans]|uniref:Uncharacterized protein n=1 Tax=Heyndrickxia coagulans TaxID=1398 RepID=A0A150KGT1_HEYCO|nr:hypothetical protein B4099_3698 [Heyndrickxia coagulans]
MRPYAFSAPGIFSLKSDSRIRFKGFLEPDGLRFPARVQKKEGAAILVLNGLSSS